MERLWLLYFTLQSIDKSQGYQGSYKTVSGERKQSQDVNIHEFSSVMVSSSSFVDPEHTLDGRWMGAPEMGRSRRKSSRKMGQ